jgi:glycosyltransferase involved in cell wall biosynthesis
MQAKVTIGVCVKNGEDYIGDAITSINGQDFPHELMEVIFVDDGSKDKTLSIIESHVPTMKMKAMVFHQDWKGLGAARNVIVNNANSEYIVWVDCDMRLSRGFVRKQVEFMNKNQNVGIAKGRYGLYDSTSLVAYLENIGAIVEYLNYEQKKLSKPLGTGGCIYRVEAIRKIGGFDENIKGVGEDMDVEHRIRKAGWILKITDTEFYEMRRTSWKALWNEYFWHGSGGQFISNEVRPKYVLYKTFPPAAFLIEFYLACTAYKLVHKNVVFLLPFHWIFKRLAWCLGFVTSYVRTNGPSLESNSVIYK